MGYRRRRRSIKHHAIKPSQLIPGERHPLTAPDAQFSPDQLNIVGYGPEQGYHEYTIHAPSELKQLQKKWPVLWVDVDGLGNNALILALGQQLNIPSLVLEDIFNVRHMPKIEIYEDFIFIILKNGIFNEIFETEQISLILMDGIVVTVQEKPGDSFLQVRNRIKDGVGKTRKFGPDYLAYALIDAIIEGYYPILDTLKQKLDEIEDKVIDGAGQSVIRQIHDIKSDLLFVHSATWPMRDITLALAHDDLPVVTTSTCHNLMDCQDQAKHVTELSEFYRLIANDLLSTHLALNDNKANEVMKVLTMVSSIFIPLGFLASLYGMNFDRASPYNMPELGMYYGYPVLLCGMLIIAVFTLGMFWKRGWFKS